MKLKFILLLSAFIATRTFAQTNVTTGTAKYTLLEEGTGTWCGYCPDGSQRLQQTVEPTHPREITASFHNGDPMALTGDPFNAAFITGFPGGSIDRVPFTHPNSSGTPVTAVNVNRGYWNTDVGVRDTVTAKFQVDLLGYYDSTTRTITLKVTGKALAALTGDYRINAYVVEDSIPSTTYMQHSYMYGTSSSWFYNQCVAPCSGTCTSCANLPDSMYAHMNVVRKILATGGTIWGDTAFLNPAVGTIKSKTYTYVIPATSPSKYTKVIGFVQKYGATTDDRAIQNAARAKVRLMQKIPAGVTDITGGIDDLQIYPNPASDHVSITGSLAASAETSVSICNTMGQVVSEYKYPVGSTMFSENISLQNLANGIYLINVSSNGQKITRKIVVNH